MNILLLLFQWCIISFGVTYLKGYVLFAANVEDFKRIAKKLGSQKFMNQLAQIANDPFENFTYKSSNTKEDVENTYIKPERQYMKKPIARQSEPKSSLNLKDDGKIDFDELVERVKQRLENEFRNKFKNQIILETEKINVHRNKVTKAYIQMRPKKKIINKSKSLSHRGTTKTTQNTIIDDENFDYEDAVDQVENKSRERFEVKVEANRDKMEAEYADAMVYEDTDKNTKGHHKVDITYEIQNDSKIYYDNIYDYENEHSKDAKSMKDNNDLSYKNIEILKDDSYEDYVTPAKERNIYISNENTTPRNRFKIKKNELKITKDYKAQPDVSDKEYSDAVTIGSREVKARTEKLWYDDNDYNDTKIISDEKIHGTGVPTRVTYKMITPNYYASLPTIAERYDFNEPLPERDRERENIKYIGNPPARINKKVRLL